MTGPQLLELTRPFPDDYVHRNPSGGGSYIKHHVINQRLIQVLGFPPDFSVREVIRGDVAGIEADPKASSKRAKEGRPALTNAVVGVIARLEVVIDGDVVAVEEAGDCEDPHNWPHDGGRLKDAMSDAYKRCAMRLGCGLHLWSQGEYFLYDKLLQAQPSKEVTSKVQGGGASQPPKDIDAASPPDSSQGSSERGDSTPKTEQDTSTQVAPASRPADSTAPATSQNGDPEDSQGASGSRSWELIEAAVEGGIKRKTDVLRKAQLIVQRNDLKLTVGWDVLPEFGETFHAELARDLDLQDTLV